MTGPSHYLGVMLVVLLLPSAMAADERSEAVWLAKKYEATREHRLWDGTRVDLLTDELAIEIDYAKNWAEAVGQALYYGIVTRRKPAIIALTGSVEHALDKAYVYRLQTVCTRYEITLFVERARYP